MLIKKWFFVYLNLLKTKLKANPIKKSIIHASGI